MRTMVVSKLSNMIPEEFFNLIFTLVNSFHAQAWHDQWNPEILLQQAGFSVLLGATAVLAVADAANNVANLVIKPRGDTEHELLSVIDDGWSKLVALQQEICIIFATCGNLHWASPMDIVFLGEVCNLGFIIFTNNVQGNRRCLYRFNPRRGDFPYWLSLYCINNAHFQVLQLQKLDVEHVRSYWAIEALPTELRRQYDVCYSNNPVGSHDGLGIS